MGTRIYVSDIHMGAGRSLGKKFVYDWLGEDEAKEFASFLNAMAADGEVEEVIFLGDTMDNWVCPVDEPPPTFDEILTARHNQTIVKSINALSRKKRLVYMPGNHDMQVTSDIIAKYFPQVVFGGSAANKSRYRTSRLLAEHGSAYAMFNAPDPINNPRTRLPLGYFISRVAATKAARTGDAKRHFWTYIDDLLEVLGPQSLSQSVFEAVLEEAGLPDDAGIVMAKKEGRRAETITVSASEVKQGYANLYDQWQSHYGKGMAFKAVMAEIGYLGDLADYLSKNGDTKIIIFGHSHESELDKDSWFIEDRIYANCGAWCDEEKPRSYIATEKDEKARVYHVRLMEWRDGKGSKVKEESVEL